jgi:hypothetical protein
MALICYYKGPGAIDTNGLEALISAYVGYLPRLAAIAQFFDFVTKDVEQKWLLAFNTPKITTKYQRGHRLGPASLSRKGLPDSYRALQQITKTQSGCPQNQQRQQEQQRQGATEQKG